MRRPRLLLVGSALSGLLALTAAATAQTPPPPVLVQGTVASATAGGLVVTAAGGQRTNVQVSGTTRIAHNLPAVLSDIHAGSFLAVTSKRGTDGSLTAIAIRIFPLAWKGTIREAEFTMESGNIMTNAVVTRTVTRVDGRTLWLAYKDGTSTITVPVATVITRLTVGRPSDFKAGQRLMVRGTPNPDGSLAATSITIEEAGR